MPRDNPLPPDKYDRICTAAKEAASATGALLIIYKGSAGTGLAVQMPLSFMHCLPPLLRAAADDLEEKLRAIQL
jgi:hypothetical protein